MLEYAKNVFSMRKRLETFFFFPLQRQQNQSIAEMIPVVCLVGLCWAAESCLSKDFLSGTGKGPLTFLGHSFSSANSSIPAL